LILELQMTRHSFGLLLTLLGVGCWSIAGGLFNQMLRIVAKLAPPKTNRPFKNLFEANNRSRVRREYQRLFPEQARRKFLLIRISTLIGIVFFLAGVFVAR
jgi:hypothetical protein